MLQNIKICPEDVKKDACLAAVSKLKKKNNDSTINIEYQKLLEILKNYLRFLKITRDYQRLPKITKDY